MVCLLTANSPIIQVVPNNGNKTIVALIRLLYMAHVYK